MFGGPPLLTGSLEGIAISSDARNYFVTAYQGGPNIVEFDAATKSPTILSTFNALNWNTRGLAIDPANPQELFVAADHWTGVGGGSLLAIDTVTSNTTTLSSGQNLVRPTSVAEDPAGNLFVVDAGLDGNPIGTVLQINPVTGQQTIISQGGDLLTPLGIIVVPEPSGALLLACAGSTLVAPRKREILNRPHA